MPLTTPPVTVAIEVLLLLHVPPLTLLLSVVVAPTHMLAVPVMAGGAAKTVTAIVVAQPVDVTL